ncbi:hypothetical protein HGA91_06620 [candidate division WWE3 bacterium]|nr:hypothetical protein [candidate division WWE3 bacterium]
MEATALPLQHQWNIRLQQNGCIELHQCDNFTHGVEYASWLIPQQINRHAIMMICRGQHLLPMYKTILAAGNSEPCAVMMGDEVMGDAFHLESYELEYLENGLIDMISRRGIPFYRILSRSPSLQGTLRQYSSTLRGLLDANRSLHIFVEIDSDGSVAGLRSLQELENPNVSIPGWHFGQEIVGLIDASTSRQRVSISHKLMHQADHVWVFAFGEDRNWVVRRMIEPQLSLHEACAATLLRDCRGVVHLFTDQVI